MNGKSACEYHESMAVAAAMTDPIAVVKNMISAEGFALMRGLIPEELIQQTTIAIEQSDGAAGVRRRRGTTYAIRNLLNSVPGTRPLAESPQLRSIIDAVLGGTSRIVRAILFDKNPDANWCVPWHQDTTIAVRRRRDCDGFGPWSVKAGIHHVQPPAQVLSQMLTARIHLDSCTGRSGALMVLPESHRFGILNATDIGTHKASKKMVVCEAAPGDVLLMRPLFLHSSAPSVQPSHRRIVHLEFAATTLPGGLEWCAE